MKKNLLSILILALIVVNMFMTAFILFSVMSTNAKTAQVISDIAAAVDLEANSGMDGDSMGLGSNVNVDISNRAIYNIENANGNLTFTLKPGEDGAQHYAVVSAIVLSMDTSNPDYETYGSTEALNAQSSLLQSRVGDVFLRHTLEELSSDPSVIRAEILSELQAMYNGSRFIYDVSLSGLLTQ